MRTQGTRLSARYARILAAFAIWAGLGVGALILAAGQWLIGAILMFGIAATIVITVDGRLLKERVYSTFDLVTQWIVLVVALLTVLVLVVALGASLLRPVLPLALVYLIGLIVALLMALGELRKGVRE